jgi:hypothetical protein
VWIIITDGVFVSQYSHQQLSLVDSVGGTQQWRMIMATVSELCLAMPCQQTCTSATAVALLCKAFLLSRQLYCEVHLGRLLHSCVL